jgi:hypothetical protein
MVRSGDGKTRIDSGNTSVITDPRAQQVMVLDHLTKEARILPMQSAPVPPQQPGMAASGAAPPPFQPPPMRPGLGQSVIDGHEVDGKVHHPTAASSAAPQAPQVAVRLLRREAAGTADAYDGRHVDQHLLGCR